MKHRRLFPLAVSAALAFAAQSASSAAASGSAYLGAWTIRSAVEAPWADPKSPPDKHERDGLIGKVVRLSARAITGPAPFPCKGPHYALKSYTPDMLFQGQFGEMQSNNPKVDPAALAAQVGFKGKTVRTLETGCEIDWHFVDAHTVEIGLDDWIFTLTKP